MSSKRNILFVVISLLLISSLLSAQQIKEYEKTLPLDKNGRVSVDTYKGTIEVETWDKDEVYFYAKVEPDTDGWNSTSPEEQLERCEVRFNHSSDYLSLESDYKKNILGSNTLALVHYKIKMPATAKLKIDDYKSVTSIVNLKADVNLESYKGDIKLTGYTGDLFIDTYKGSVYVEFEAFMDDAEFDTYKGEVDLLMPASSKFDFDFDLGRRGDFKSDFDMLMKSYQSDEGARGTVNGGGPEIKFSTYKGEIKIRKK